MLGWLLSAPGSAGAYPIPVLLKDGKASVAPTHGTIRMDSAETIIRLGPKSYTVDAVFHFYNTGDRTTQWVGFPKPRSGLADDVTHELDKFKFSVFEAWVNGRKVDISEERDDADVAEAITTRHRPDSRPGSRVKEITFLGHTATTVRVRYVAGYIRSAAANLASYGIESGRHWKAPIRKVVVVIDSSRVGGIKQIRTNAGREREPPRAMGGYLVTYDITDFERDPWFGLGIRVSTLRKLKRH